MTGRCDCTTTRWSHNAPCDHCEARHATEARRDAARAGEWLPDVTYPVDHPATWGGVRYRATREHTSQPGSPPPAAGLWEAA